MPVQLTRVIPERHQRVEAQWCNPTFCEYGVLKATRDRFKQKTPTGCWWCHADFSDDDILALAYFRGQGTNKLLCQECAGQLKQVFIQVSGRVNELLKPEDEAT